MKRSSLLAQAALVAVALASGSARAQEAGASAAESHGVDDASRTEALRLFREGRALMAQKRYDEAIGRFLQSEQRDPAAGTLLNLAYCYEELGRTATAWAIYRQAAVIASDSGRADWSASAKQRVASLEGTLFRVTIEARPDASVGGFRIFVDGAPLPENAWGEGVPLYPGLHEIRAEANARQTWTLTFPVDADHLPTISVPELPLTVPQTTARLQDPVTAGARVPVPNRLADKSPYRTTSIVVGGAGLASLAVATGLTLAAKSTYDSARCESGVHCTPSQVAANSRAYVEGDAATVTAVTGGVAIACATILWFAFPANKERSRSAEFAIVPSAEAALVGASVREVW